MHGEAGTVFDDFEALPLNLPASWVLVLTGVMTERASGGLADHEAAAAMGAPGAVLGYLFDPTLKMDTGSRALVLLGVMVERLGHPLDEVLRMLADDDWAMSPYDKALLLLVAAVLRPKRAIDAGTYLGGSAAALALWCDEVITIDMDPAKGANVNGLSNVEFRAGIASDVLADVLDTDPEVELVMLDADHTELGVAAEVREVLRRPSSGLRAILVHDTTMESCMRGLESVDWSSDPSVRGVTLDFLPGVIVDKGIAGGMALVWTHPTGRLADAT